MSKRGKNGAHNIGKTFGTPFKKGESGNPSGSSKRSKEMAAVKNMTQEQFAKTASKIISMNVTEMKELAEDKQANVFDAIFARVLTRAYDNGNTHDLNYFVERCMGKVADNVNIAGNMHGGIMAFLESRNGNQNGQQEKDVSTQAKKVSSKKGQAKS